MKHHDHNEDRKNGFLLRTPHKNETEKDNKQNPKLTGE